MYIVMYIIVLMVVILIIVGQAGGNYYTNKGGGSNYLCLPNDPDIGKPTRLLFVYTAVLGKYGKY
jgi:hypothetical protein